MTLVRKTLFVFALLLAVAPFANAQVCNRPRPTLIGPENGAVNVAADPVTYSWNPVAGTYGYKVFASYNGEPFEQIGDTTATNFSDNQPYGTQIRWYVEAKFDECNSRSDTFTFTTVSCAVGTTTLLEPADATKINSPVRFSWTEVEGSEFYRLWLIYEDEEGELQFYVLDETWRTTTTVRINPGVYGWFIETIFECDSTVSDVYVFQIERNQNCSEVKPTIVSPAEGSTTTSPVEFRWNPVPGAIGYQVWAALDEGDYEFVDETDADRTYTEAYLGYGAVKWIVIAQFNGCDDVWSDEATFTIPYNPECDNGAPFPISPPWGTNNAPTRVDFIWTPVSKATKYNVWVIANDADPVIIGSSTTSRLTATVPVGEIWWAVEVEFADCPPDISPASLFQSTNNTVCEPPPAPEVYVDPEALSDDEYVLVWSPGINTASYEVQESTSPEFPAASTTTTTTTEVVFFLHHRVTVPTRYYYRVRSASSCGQGIGPYSEIAEMVVTPTSAVQEDDARLVSSYGAQNVVVQKIFIPGQAGVGGGAAEVRYVATTDQPWLRVEPSEFTVPPQGIEVTLTADPRELPVGTNTATLLLNSMTSDGKKAVPVSISLVTPVATTPSNSPTSDSLIIPVVAHAVGGGASFESDVRIANASAQSLKYLLNFTPSNTDGTKNGKQATIQVEPGQTTALNDILRNFYGFSTAGDNVSGVLEIRPVVTNQSGDPTANTGRVTFASSRTYADTPSGTYGQFVPAIPYSDFIARGSALSLQQIAKSANYRTNIGLVEAAGESATVRITLFDERGQRINEFTRDLLPGQQTQFPLETAVENGRLEVAVIAGEGRVTAYASVLDNQTADPLLVMPVVPAGVRAARWILPGIADLNTGSASWRSDVRLFNGGTAPVNATFSYYPRNEPGNPRTITRTIQPGRVEVIDSALQSLYSRSNDAGSLVITTPADAQLVASARTYNDTGKGTYGQFIPGITVGEGVGLGQRALQILQVEESDRFRTNVGIVELTGNPVQVEIGATSPDSRVSVKVPITLQGNQFLQKDRILAELGMGTTYNARITLRVIGGTGRISGYASLIDNRTQDPTYVPAQ